MIGKENIFEALSELRGGNTSISDDTLNVMTETLLEQVNETTELDSLISPYKKLIPSLNGNFGAVVGKVVKEKTDAFTAEKQTLLQELENYKKKMEELTKTPPVPPVPPVDPDKKVELPKEFLDKLTELEKFKEEQLKKEQQAQLQVAIEQKRKLVVEKAMAKDAGMDNTPVLDIILDNFDFSDVNKTEEDYLSEIKAKYTKAVKGMNDRGIVIVNDPKKDGWSLESSLEKLKQKETKETAIQKQIKNISGVKI